MPCIHLPRRLVYPAPYAPPREGRAPARPYSHRHLSSRRPRRSAALPREGRNLLRPHSHPTDASASGVKGDVLGTHLSKANAEPRGLCAALSHWRCQCSAVGARTGARTAELLAREPNARRERSKGALALAPRPRLATPRSPPLARPSASRPEGSPPMAINRLAIGSRASSFAVRAPCAHQRREIGKAIGSRPAQPFGSAKGPAHRQKLFSPFFKNPLALRGAM